MKVKKIIKKILDKLDILLKYGNRCFSLTCQECGGKLHIHDVYIDRFYNQHTVYKCEKCGKEWITL